ncbi:MAG: DUF6499 domain-containing protein [Acidobacteriota bacterium]|nr:DUF6499 domain-containing protein [Acidobacteriota bacterium]
MADWRNPEDYTYTQGLTLHQWAWEFLRRNSDYRDDWRAFEALEDPIMHTAEQSSVYRSASRKWGLAYPVDPSLNATEADVHFAQAVNHLGLVYGYASDGNELVTVLEFDLEKPISPQVQIAEKYLLQQQGEYAASGRIHPAASKSRPHQQRHLYPVYIRLLDGHLEGVGTRKMGDLLFAESPDPRQRARDGLRSAKKLATSSYRDLLLFLDE